MAGLKKILFIASHRRDRSPNQRFRFEQYTAYLENNGFDCELSELIDEETDKVLYRQGGHLDKVRFVRNCYRIRRKDLKRLDEFDIVFICREALMTRSTYFEKKFAASKAKVVFDFDDSIWLSNVSDANKRWKWMKNPNKTAKLIALADVVFAGNEYLAKFAREFNSEIRIIPTTIDTEEYRKADVECDDKVCVGWSGSITTIQHFEFALPFLKKIKERFGEKVVFRVVGDGSYRNVDLDITGLPWKKDSEIADLSRMDIGIMPLPDDEWAKGKCGLKGLQYMALGIPTIMSPVGVNTGIIEHGVNGALASTEEEWVAELSKLIEDAELRRRIGEAARKTVEERYSVKANEQKYLQAFRELLEGNKDQE